MRAKALRGAGSVGSLRRGQESCGYSHPAADMRIRRQPVRDVRGMNITSPRISRWLRKSVLPVRRCRLPPFRGS